MTEEQSSSYDAKSIEVLKGLSAVRLRPSMYIGHTDSRGLHHLTYEILDNSVDEAMSGFCTQIDLLVHEDGQTITVTDNGRGIPVDMHPGEGKSALEVVLTTLHGGGKFNNNNYSGGSGGLHGVGASCVNALSDHLEAIVWRDGGAYRQTYQRGIPDAPCARTGDSRKHGTQITFHPDFDIFSGGINISDEVLTKRLREVSYLNTGLKINYVNKNANTSHTFHTAEGISDYVRFLNSTRVGSYPSEPFYCDRKSGTVEVKIGLQYTMEDEENILCFTNNIYNQDGGTHLSGFKTALTRVINQFARANGLLKATDSNLSGDDIREGLTAIISVRLQQPQFESQTKVKLLSLEVEGAVNTVLGESLTEFFEKNPSVIKDIVDRAQIAQKAREAAKRQSELIKRKSFIGKNNRLPGKLKDCNTEDRTKSELFIVEGDSAAGSAEDGRDAEFQAVLPIRGKIINAEKTDLESLLKNNEIQSLIAAIGAGVEIGDDGFNLDNRRYDKVVILTDADVDGSHIVTLLLTFFYRYMKPLIMQGHIYVAQPPLYGADTAKGRKYYWEESEMRAASARGAKPIRFKGLGEMNFEELGTTTMAPSTRQLKRVIVPDAREADEMFHVLMGRNVAIRKAHIIEYSHNAGEVM